MRSQKQNNNGAKLTIFKPPVYIYKLSKTQSKNSHKLEYEIYYNKQYSLRKYKQSINLASQSQLLLYEWRKQSTSPILKVVYVQLTKKSSSSSSLQNNLIDVSIYTQHIEKVLADMINLTLNEAIYVLNECILAYKQLFQKFSAVSINKFHVGLDAQGRLKVWINQNPCLNCIQDKSSQSQSANSQTLFVQTVIVNKIIHMVSLLSNPNCKFFFFALQKELAIKRFLFNNCLQYIQNFVKNTNNFQISINLFYMLPKKTSFCLDRSSVRLTSVKKQKNPEKQRKLSENLSFLNTSTFKYFGSVVRNNRQKIEKPRPTINVIKQTKSRSRKCSENILKDRISTLPVSKAKGANKSVSNLKHVKKQCKVSLLLIAQKSRKNSIKSNCIAITKNSNISTHRQRPSINIVPSFIAKSSKKNMSRQKDERSSQESKRNSQKSHSLKSSKSKDFSSLLNSKVSLRNSSRFCQFKPKQIMNKNSKNSRNEAKSNLNNKYQGQSLSKTRGRSVSASIKFCLQKLSNHRQDLTQYKSYQRWNAQNQISEKRKSYEKTKNDTDKVSTNSISNDDTAKNRSFVTKTNYDSITMNNDKMVCRSGMNFSSISIQNRISNKNFDSDITSSQKKDVKRSLMAFNCGFQQILENPSCKEVQEENEQKSCNGQSLKNTQKISQFALRNQGEQETVSNNLLGLGSTYQRNRKEQETVSNNLLGLGSTYQHNRKEQETVSNNLLGLGSTYQRNRKEQETVSNNLLGLGSTGQRNRKDLQDSGEQDWAAIKQKNQELIIKNQWTKTINNLELLQDLVSNQSIVDASDQVVQRDPYPDIRLQKLDRLGRDMCFSIVKRSSEVASTMKPL